MEEEGLAKKKRKVISSFSEIQSSDGESNVSSFNPDKENNSGESNKGDSFNGDQVDFEEPQPPGKQKKAILDEEKEGESPEEKHLKQEIENLEKRKRMKTKKLTSLL